jgi:hypothetical protein
MEIPILNSENRLALPHRHSRCQLSDPVPPGILSHFTVCRPLTSVDLSPGCSRKKLFSHESPLSKKFESRVSFSPYSSELHTTLLANSPSSSILPLPSTSPTSTVYGDQRVHEAHRQEHGVEESRPILCEFDREACPNGAKNPRKCISHFFGRNKTCTKGFPTWVWVYYCRKHYQRARYRSDSWPFKQCDIFHETLDRMEAWGGVLSFRLTLRRREHRRSPSETLHDGMNDLPSEPPPPSPPPSSSSSSKPRDLTVPVPSWLRAEVGANKTFQDIRNIIERIRQYMQGLRDAYRPVAFPDIEILPTFRTPALNDASEEDDEDDSDHSNPQVNAIYPAPGAVRTQKRKGSEKYSGKPPKRRR